MKPALSIACRLAALLVGAAALSAPAGALEVERYAFLKGTRWYVPSGTLPALLYTPATGTVTRLIDQTLWDITDYDKGYFGGRTVAVLRDAQTGERVGEPSCMRMIGSVTPEGTILISFLPVDAKTATSATTGFGKLDTRGEPRFTMQMSTGTVALAAHWSYMVRCSPGQPCQTRLPGSRLGVSGFLALCGWS